MARWLATRRDQTLAVPLLDRAPRPDFASKAAVVLDLYARVRHGTPPHEYDRGGAPAYLAVWDVHRGWVFGRCEPTTGIAPFRRLVEQVMTMEPYASARRMFWVVGNGSSHRGQTSIDRMTNKWPTARLVHTRSTRAG